MRTRTVMGALLTILTGTAIADADTWSIVRRDPQRTAASQGTLFDKKAMPAWRAFMGGRPTDGAVLFRANEPLLITATGGRIAAKHVKNQATVWKSDLLGDGTVADVADLDGDGKLEVVTRTVDAAWVLDHQTGHTLWRSPPEQFHYTATVRVIDLDGDNLPEVYIDECSACATPGTMTAGAFTFKAGAKNGSALWTRALTDKPEPRHNGTDAIVDLNDDGIPEIALGSADRMLIVRASDGKAIAELTDPNWPLMFQVAGALALELDEKPGKELLISSIASMVGGGGPTGFAVYKLDPTTGQWTHLWTQSTGAFDAEVTDVADVACDLDGNGRFEVILSFRASSTATTWTTRVLDGATGTITAELAGRFEGAAELDGNPGDELLLATPDGLVPYTWTPTGVVALAAPLPGMRAYTVVDPALRNRGPQQRRLAVIKRAGEPAELIVGAPATGDTYALLGPVTSFADARAVRVGANVWINGGQYVPDNGVITGAFRADYTTRPYPQIAIGKSVGTVDVLDASMKPTNGTVQAGGNALGTRIGGNWLPMRGTNLIANDAVGPFVVLPDGPTGLIVGDARFASWIVPPLARWQAPDLRAVSFLDLGSLGTAVVGVEGTTLVARNSAGGTKIGGGFELGPGYPQGTPLPLRPGASTAVAGIDWMVSGVQVIQHAADFSTGTELWNAEPLPAGGYFGSGVGDLDGNGVDEWYSMHGPLYRRDVATGSVTSALVSSGYALPMLASFSKPKATEILLQAGGYGPKLVSANLSLVWEGPYPEAFHTMAGTRVICTNGPRFVTPAVTSPVLRAYAGSDGALVAERVLAGGAVYPSVDAAKAAGARVGMLMNASSIAKVPGTTTGAVVVGSSDAFLYILDACTLDLVWSVDLDAPVGEASIGDYDNDGSDEILVGTSAGYVYGIDHLPLAAPTAFMVSGVDAYGVVKIQPGASLSLSWEPVSGATGYQLALVGPDEQALWQPAYKDVNATSETLDLPEALAGRPYRFVIRAVAVEGHSADAMSAPIVVEDLVPPTASVTPEPRTGGNLTLHLQADDNLALDHYVATWKNGSDDVARLAGDAMLSGVTATATVNIAIPESSWNSEIEIAVDVVDTGDNDVTTTLKGFVASDGAVSIGDRPADGSTEESNGCGCRTGASRNGPSGIAMLALAVALALRRRTRSASA